MASQEQSVLCTVEEFLSSPFDFIIVGGGTAGLLLAARLAENEQFQIGVLEAGGNKLQDPFVNVPNLFPQIQNKSGYDWMLKSVPQVVVPPAAKRPSTDTNTRNMPLMSNYLCREGDCLEGPAPSISCSI